MDYHSLSSDKIFEKLSTSSQGLTTIDAKKRIKKYGPNLLPADQPISIYKIVISQLLDPLILILFLAGILTRMISDMMDFYIILSIIILEFIIGFASEYRAQKIIEKLIKITQTKAKVLRDNNLVSIPAGDLVVGDIIQISAGDKVPADARILDCDYLLTDESILTGESKLQEKSIDLLPAEKPITEQSNIIFQGTYISHGSAVAVVIKTGLKTEFGKISASLISVKRPVTPLQKRLRAFSKAITLIVVAVSVAFLLSGIYLDKNIYNLILIAISLCVAAIPESFPIIVIIALTVTMARLARRRIYVKHLSSVETLGSTSVICLDKTGTLTTNQPTVKKITMANNDTYYIDKADYSPEGNYIFQNNNIKPIDIPDLEMIISASTVCNDSSISKNKNGVWQAVGDPTEAALVSMSAKANMDPNSLNERYQRISTIPFRSGLNFMATYHIDRQTDNQYIFIKGSPETVIELCSYQLSNGKALKLNPKDKKEYIEKIDLEAEKSYRLIAVAYKELPKNNNHEKSFDDTDLKYGVVFMGTIALVDPLRPTAINAYKEAKQAGLNVILVTGDHPATAINIASFLGMKLDDANVITGSELANLSDKDFEARAENIKLYARVIPEQKLKIVQYWQQKGQIVAMTGDGVNDAPALKKADIGIAMGNGTDVAKESAEIILQDNDFSRIISTIKQGRVIYDNIKKTIVYLLGHNLGTVGLIFVSLLTRLPLPLLPTQILWMNLVTDGLLDESLIFEPGEKNIMEKGPRSSSEKFITRQMLFRIMFFGIFMAIISYFVYIYYLNHRGVDYARTIVFALMSIFSIFGIYSCRGLNISIWQIKPSGNIFMIVAGIISLLMQIAVIYVPSLQIIFHTQAIYLLDLGFVFLISFFLLILIEIQKYTFNIILKKELA